MNRTILTALFAAAVALPVAVAVPAAASESRCEAPMSQWQPREALKKKLTAKGMEVRQIKTENGCYEVKAIDAAGRRVEANYNPKTLAQVGVENDD